MIRVSQKIKSRKRRAHMVAAVRRGCANGQAAAASRLHFRRPFAAVNHGWAAFPFEYRSSSKGGRSMKHTVLAGLVVAQSIVAAHPAAAAGFEQGTTVQRS